MRPFDALGELPEGTVVLEASAGTGKTTAIASLAVRFVAEGRATLPELMLVTFGRDATAELRERVRARFVEVERALRQPTLPDDPVARLLADTGPQERRARRDRLARALADFDAATITTTHGFCQQMLAVLGTLGDVERGVVLAPDIADLEAELVDDLYLRKYADEASPMLGLAEARKIAHESISDRAAALRPTETTAGTAARDRVRLAQVAREELLRRKQLRRVIDYDDLLELLRDALVGGPDPGAAAERVRGPYRVVMVDEFQDTDPVQWDILRAAFHGHRTLVLIGDPKQAIYRFRGADVATYLRAAQVGEAQTLGVNWRSDAPVVEGLLHLMGGTALGDPRIVVRPVQAGVSGRRLSGGAPVRLRQVAQHVVPGRDGKPPGVGPIRSAIVADVAAQVVESLRTSRLRAGGAERPLAPGDVAVLVRTNATASAVHDALVAAGVPAVISGAANVFTSTAARDWHLLLSALAGAGDPRLAAAVALTPFVGWDTTRLGAASDEDRDLLADRMREWAHILEQDGIAALHAAAAAGGLRARLMASRGGERRLTDLRHVAEAMHQAAHEHGLGSAALLEWLATRIADADEDFAEDRSRRLETDAAAVQVVTVHAAKGLQFPVVFVPFAWDRFTLSSPAIVGFTDGDERALHVGGAASPGYGDAVRAHFVEDAGEDLRLLYVALTRAQSQVVAWWSPSPRNSAKSALTRVLLAPRQADGQLPESVKVPDDEAIRRVLGAIAASSGGTVAHEFVAEKPGPVAWSPPPQAAPALDVARFERALDLRWRRTSYSGLTAHSGHGGVAAEPEAPGIQDEPEHDVPLDDARGATHGPSPDEEEWRAVPSPMADLPGGTAFGTLVHAVLEHAQTGASDPRAELLERTVDVGLATALGVAPEALADALVPAVHTPLGPLAGGRTLWQIPPVDRLAELDFELPLAGGDAAVDGPSAVLGDLAALLRAHLPADDPFTGYADRLGHGDLAGSRLRGYLTGSIDAVLRVPGADGELRYVVVDYKTNRLGPYDEPLSAWHYRPDALVAAMQDAHYPLQLLLYSAALHRFLRWRHPGYDPERQLGGALYLFVRGMAGAGTPVVDGVPAGVMSWRPPAALVVALSDLLARGPR